MKRIFSIYPLIIATLFLMMFSVIPHHHHKEVLCLVMELCEQDDAYNDDHTSHGSEHDEDHQNTCISNADYIPSSGVVKSNLHSEDGSSYPISVLFLLANILTLSLDTPESEATYGVYVVSYASVVLGESSGLRAPPYIFS